MTAFAAYHDELRAVARDLLGKGVPDWGVLADSGWLGLELPEELDGAGATFAEVAVVLVEMGRAATASPYLGTAVLGAGALGLVEPDATRDELLREIGAGRAKVAVAVGTGDDDGPAFRLDGRSLRGEAGFVPDAVGADWLLVPARTADGAPVLVALSSGATVTGQPVLDATRRLGHVRADGVEVEASWRFVGDPGRVVERGALAIACDSLGLAEAMLDATVAYARVREQFGQPIGSFQAVKHACADMLVQVTVSRALVAAAVDALVSDAPDAAVAVARAKSYVGAAAVDVAGTAMQLHGGIGYTWESGVHVYLKRAALNRSLFGSPRYHRRRVAGEALRR